MTLNIKKLHPSATIPSRAYVHDAGLDLYASENTTLKPGERKTVRTGIAIEIPEGCVGLIWDKSGVGIHGGLKTLGGVVDAGYRGEILVGMVNLSQEELLIQKIEHLEIKEVSELSNTAREERGFGSTGI
jgi:dUTP pyrophosphatase